MSDALPEIAVADAPPAIAEIYREIAALSGIPLPALIWRHLATLPNVLPVAWGALRPFYAAGTAQTAAWRAAAAATRGHVSAVSRAALADAGIGPDLVEAYGRVLDSYNRANPVNFVGVRLLRAAMAKTELAALPVAATGVWRPPQPIAALPPMTPVSEIGTAQRRLIDQIKVDPTVDRGRVVPSLYRHLTHEPALIRLIHADLMARIASGELPDMWRRVSAALDAEAMALAVHVAPLAGLASVPGLSETLARFSGLIPEMVAVGYLLRQGLDVA